jgi:hypothetical protein
MDRTEKEWLRRMGHNGSQAKNRGSESERTDLGYARDCLVPITVWRATYLARPGGQIVSRPCERGATSPGQPKLRGKAMAEDRTLRSLRARRQLNKRP